MFTNGISTGELSHNYQVAQICIGANFFCSDPDKQDKDIELYIIYQWFSVRLQYLHY